MLGWAGHVARMKDICTHRKELYTQLEGLRKVGRPHVICIDEVGNDARMLGIGCWWAAAVNLEERSKRLEEDTNL
jgi:hypothetical protein